MVRETLNTSVKSFPKKEYSGRLLIEYKKYNANKDKPKKISVKAI